MRGEEEREEKGGRRMREEVGGGGGGGEGGEVMSHSDSEKDMSAVLVPDPDKLMRSGNETSRQYVPFW